jgi:hypothetical protein
MSPNTGKQQQQQRRQAVDVLLDSRMHAQDLHLLDVPSFDERTTLFHSSELFFFPSLVLLLRNNDSTARAE